MSETRQLCTFHLDGLLYGIEVTQVQEVIRYQDMTRIPLAPPDVRGLINLRGQIVVAIDTRHRLGLPSLTTGAFPMNVVIRTDDGTASLLVDEIGDVIEVTSAMAEAIPATVPARTRGLFKGVFKLDGHLLLELDIERVVGGKPRRAA